MTTKTYSKGPELLIDMLEGGIPDKEAIRQHIQEPCRQCVTHVLVLKLILTDPWMNMHWCPN